MLSCRDRVEWAEESNSSSLPEHNVRPHYGPVSVCTVEKVLEMSEMSAGSRHVLDKRSVGAPCLRDDVKSCTGVCGAEALCGDENGYQATCTAQRISAGGDMATPAGSQGQAACSQCAFKENPWWDARAADRRRPSKASLPKVQYYQQN